MRHAFTCLPTSGNPHATALEFTWDPEAGTVEGPGAALIHELVAHGYVKLHPLPRAPYKLGPDPLRSWRDMAAIVGSEWLLPTELEERYPKNGAPCDGAVRDEDGGAVEFVAF
jgi:hypothetical protein